MDANIIKDLSKNTLLNQKTKEKLSKLFLFRLTEEKPKDNQELLEIINFAIVQDLPEMDVIVQKAKLVLIKNKVENLKVQVVNGTLEINDKTYMYLNAEERLLFAEYIKLINSKNE